MRPVEQALISIVLLIAALVAAAIFFGGCDCGNLPLDARDLAPAAPDLRCSPITNECASGTPHEIEPCTAPDGGLIDTVGVVDGNLARVGCYVGAGLDGQDGCAPNPLQVVQGYPYVVVTDCAKCAPACAP